MSRFLAGLRVALAWAFTAGAVAFLIAVLRERPVAEWDLTVLVLSATLLALIWTGYYTSQLAEQARLAAQGEERRRSHAYKVLAAAVSAELAYLTGSVEAMTADDPSSFVPHEAFEHQTLRDALRQADLFSPDTAARLAGAAAVLRTLSVFLRRYEQAPLPARATAIGMTIPLAFNELEGLSRSLESIDHPGSLPAV